MNEMVQIRSVKHYFNEFIVEGLKGKDKVQEIDLIDIKTKILEAFRKEVFGQIVFKLGPEVANMSTNEIAKLDGIQNILQQAFRKWKRLCILCGEYGLGSFFQLEDLKRILEDDKEVPILEEDVTGQVPEGTVILDEETMKPVEHEEESSDGEGTEDAPSA